MVTTMMTKERRMLDKIRIPKTLVRAGSSANVRMISERGPFRTDWISLPDEVGKHFYVTDFKVGKNSQLISPASISGSFFSLAVQGALKTEVLWRGAIITLSVTNVSNEERALEGEILGEVVSDPDDAVAPSGTLAVVGMGRNGVPEGGKLSLTLQSQYPVLFDRLVLPAGTLDDFRVCDLRVVGRSLLAQGELTKENLLFELVLVRTGDWIVVEVERRPVPPAPAPEPPPATPSTGLEDRSPGFWKRLFSRRPLAPTVEEQLVDKLQECRDLLAQQQDKRKNSVCYFTGTLAGTFVKE